MSTETNPLVVRREKLAPRKNDDGKQVFHVDREGREAVVAERR